MTTWRYLSNEEAAAMMEPPANKPWVQKYPNDQIKRLARAYCVNLGLDPDERVQVNFNRYMLVGEFTGGGVYDTPGFQWEMYRADAQKALAMRDALMQSE